MEDLRFDGETSEPRGRRLIYTKWHLSFIGITKRAGPNTAPEQNHSTNQQQVTPPFPCQARTTRAPQTQDRRALSQRGPVVGRPSLQPRSKCPGQPMRGEGEQCVRARAAAAEGAAWSGRVSGRPLSRPHKGPRYSLAGGPRRSYVKDPCSPAAAHPQ